MATTKYEVFCRYFNGDVNKCVTNQTEVEWVGREAYIDLEAFYNSNKTEFLKLKSELTRPTNARRRKDFSVHEEDVYAQCSLYEQYQTLRKNNLLAEEVCTIEPADHLFQDQYGTKRKAKMARDLAHWDTIIAQTNVNNPKYDMIFMYDGLAKVEGGSCLNPPQNDKHQNPYIYFDRMRRVNFDIWFLHSVHASLASAMTKANELVNIVGKNSIKIGKVVPLDKYIEIV